MFYSTEILSDKKYALSTVWRAGNTAPGARSTGLRRKAVFEVDVRRACGTIREPPGAPIALRLQGTLLYGTARIFQEQCRFVLNDSERVQRALRRLCSSLDDKLDAAGAGGRARAHHIVLPNDPGFDLDLLQLPPFDFDAPDGSSFLSQSHQSWTNLSLPSRTSPVSPVSQLVLDADSSGGRSFAGGGGGSAGSFGRYSASNASVLPADQATPLGQRGLMSSFADEDNLLVDVGLFIDENGNIVEQEAPSEPQLPSFPAAALKGATTHGGDAAAEEDALVPVPMVLDDDGELVHPAVHLAEATAKAADPSLFSPSMLAESSPQKTVKQVGAGPRPRHRTNFVDEITQIPLSDYFRCVTHYADNMARAVAGRDRARAARRAHDAAGHRQAAYDGTLGRGLFGVGQLQMNIVATSAVPAHPLVQLFSGDALAETLYGEKLVRAKRRKLAADAAAAVASAAAPSTPLGRHGPFGFDGDELEIERGRQPGSALSDNPSLALHRAPSSVAGSVQQSGGTNRGPTGIGGIASSAGGPSSPGFLERYSDDGSFFGGGLNFGSGPGPGSGPGSQAGQGGQLDAAVDDDDDLYMSGAIGTRTQTQTQTNSQLGEEMRNTTRFLALVQSKAETAETSGPPDCRWVAFDDVVAPFRGDRPAVVGAFMSLLTLATAHRLRVGAPSATEELSRLDRAILIGVPADRGTGGRTTKKGKGKKPASRKRAFNEMVAGSDMGGSVWGGSVRGSSVRGSSVRGSSVRGSSVRGSSVATAMEGYHGTAMAVDA